MATPEKLLIESFEAVKVPELMVTGELDADPIVSATKDSFVEEAVAALRLKERAAGLILSIDHNMFLDPNSGQRYSDDFYTRLRLTGVQTLVSVERSRDSWNYMVVQFARHHLGETAIKQILQYSEFGDM